jgi:predicted transcriptional regulator
LNIGTLVHHARILEKEGHINKKRDGFNIRFYPIGMKAHNPNKFNLNEVQKNLIEIIRVHPGITQRKIISLLNSSQQVISYNLLNLSRINIIRVEQHGRENRYYINYQTSESNRDQDLNINQGLDQTQQFKSSNDTATYMSAAIEPEFKKM